MSRNESEGRLRRLAMVGTLYVLGSSLVIGTAREVASLLILPELFLTLLAGAAVLGLPLALVIAWRYQPPPDRRR